MSDSRKKPSESAVEGCIATLPVFAELSKAEAHVAQFGGEIIAMQFDLDYVSPTEPPCVERNA